MNIDVRNKTVLFCILNWGLGHASRSIPIIRNLEINNCKVIIASDGVALTLLKTEFPENIYYELPSYGIKYSISPLVGTILSLPYIIRAFIYENRIVTKIVIDETIDIIISDNRYGTYSSVCDSFLITHQLNPFFFVRPKLFQNILLYFFSFILSKFSMILVPDDKILNITGVLSQNKYVKIPIKNIGILSRFSSKKCLIGSKSKTILVIISGPEPARSIFEKYIFSELDVLKYPVTIVLGRKIEHREIFKSNFDVKGIVSSSELLILCENSRLIVSRSGYSSIMDYLSMEADAILIPTPGMPEQEYLAQIMTHRCLFHVILQEKNALSNKVLKLSSNS